MSQFCHLHCHSEYSLLDGMSRIEDMVLRAKELEQPAIALTDHGVMFGAIEFYRAAQKHGVKPIMGVEAYLAPRGMQDRDPQRDRQRYHMLLLAQNQAGYQNLLKLCSKAQLEGFYGKPRIDKETLAAHSEGIIATTGCLAAEVPRILIDQGEEAAYQRLKWYLDVFGRDRFFLELQPHDIEELKTVNGTLMAWSRKHGVGLVATNDVHYVRKEDAKPHDVLLCIQTHEVLSKANRMRLSPDGSYYITSHAEMLAAFSEYPEALSNTLRIAEMCEVNLDMQGYHLPEFPVPEGYEAADYLRALVEEGIRERYGAERAERDPVLRERTDREVRIIHEMGFDNYFLIVWDLCRFAAEVDIWWNVRGSGAGSVVAYALKITNIDPIKNDLIFERFLNPSRVSMPDIDIDFPDDRRHEMIEYTVRRYGQDKCAAIITFGTLGARAAVRDVGRTLEIPLTEVDRVARIVPNVPGKPVTLKNLLFDDASAEEWPTEAADLREVYRSDPVIRNLLDTAIKLEGQTRHASTHAAGVVIADKPVVEYAPLHRPTKGDDSGPIQQVVQFDMNIVESIGLLKVDFLGLATLSIMRCACEHIERRHGRKLNLSNIPYERCPDDPEQDKDILAAYQLMQAGDTTGVFQVEGAGLRRTLQEMQPDQFEHIIAAISLYRPGPMEYIPAYIRRMHGQEPVRYHHPLLQPILENTYAILVYQEQIMRVASDLGGYSPGEADLMRRAVSKKKAKDIEYHKAIFVAGAMKKGVDQETAEKIYADIEFFARYGFNKCLTATTEICDVDTGKITKIGDLHEGRTSLNTLVTCDTDSLTLQHGRVGQVMFNGVKPVFKLRTALGRTIEATANHPFYGFDGWRLLGELQEGDFIAVPRRLPVEGKTEWPEHQVIALGHLLAEGNLCHPHSVYFYNQEMVQVEDYIQAAEQFENVTCTITMHKGTYSIYARRINRKEPPEIITWAKELGIWGKDARHKEIPPAAFELTNRQIALLLSRMWAGDGCILEAERLTYYATSSERLAHQVQHLLLRLGIISKVRTVIFPYKDGRVAYQVTITGKENLETFAETVGSRRLHTRASVVLQASSHERIVRVAEYLDDPALRRYVDNDIYWDRVVSIEYVGEQPTYDLEVPGTHNFIANDILVHNSHAADYAVITVQTAYLKAHYPVEYLCALLEVEFDDTTKVPIFLSECRRLEIDVLPPDINASGPKFTIEPSLRKAHLPEGDYRRWAIRVGMGAVKNVGLGAVEMILAEREANGLFQSLDEFCERVDLRQVNRRVLECLAKVGCFDNLVRPIVPDAPRETVLAVVERMIGISAQLHEAAEVGQLSMFDNMAALGAAVEKSSVLRPLPDVGHIPPKQRLMDEKELLGIYISEHPLQQVEAAVGRQINCFCSEIGAFVGQSIVVAGLLTGHRVITTKKGERMAFLKIEDLHGETEVVLFPRSYEQAHAQDLLKVDTILLVRGKVEARNETVSILADAIHLYEAQALAPTDSPAPLGRSDGPPPPPPPEESSPLESIQHHITLRLRYVDDGQDVARVRRVLQSLQEHPGSDRVRLHYTRANGQTVQMDFPTLTTRWNRHLHDTLQAQEVEIHIENITPDPRARRRRGATAPA